MTPSDAPTPDAYVRRRRAPSSYRGSRKHVLDWTAQPLFAVELLRLLAPVDVRLTAAAEWLPAGPGLPGEARLEWFGPRVLPGSPVWPALTAWWLRHPRGANTPNWDLVVWCEVEGRPGLVLVEAKANVPELSPAGKRREPGASEHSDENHAHIGAAIAEAREALRPLLPDISIDHESHYQLANRIAFGWRLASLGIPTVLVYLGFTGDRGIADVGEPFADHAHWHRVFGAHLAEVGAVPALERRLDLGPAPLWLLSRSRGVLEHSPPAASALAPVVHSDPEILGGTPVFVGTRVPFQALFDHLKAGDPLDEFLEDFPSVTREQAVAALKAARDLVFAQLAANDPGGPGPGTVTRVTG